MEIDIIRDYWQDKSIIELGNKTFVPVLKTFKEKLNAQNLFMLKCIYIRDNLLICIMKELLQKGLVKVSLGRHIEFYCNVLIA